MTTREEISNLLFPHIDETIEDIKKKYPKRTKNIVTRFAPSPTGFLHIWSLRTAFIAWKYAQQNDWIFILRIEDTDQKRTVENWISQMINSLKMFWIPINEWPIWENNLDIWNYWPYIQSKRKYIYHIFVKELVKKWLAYPCWLSKDEIENIKENQKLEKKAPWIYWNYSIRRQKSADDILKKLSNENNISLWEEWEKNFVIRFRSNWKTWEKIIFDDILRWKINMADNFNDHVLLKSWWLPTYHLAHIVDDFLMWTNPIIRAEERLTSVPFHLQLQEAFWLEKFNYCHLSQLLKIDNETWKKRKLSKRKDPESNVEYLLEQGFSKEWILDYLLILVDSEYENRQKENINKTLYDFDIKLEKTNKAWALVDLIKLKNVNNNYLSKISNEELYKQTLNWSEKYDFNFYKLIKKHKDLSINAIWIERFTDKDPKRFSTYIDVKNQLEFFYNEIWESNKNKIWLDELNFPENLSSTIINDFLNEYVWKIDLNTDTQWRFDWLKQIAWKYKIAWNNKEFKQWWYIGKIWDIAMILRIKLCLSKKTPDLFSVMKVLWYDEVKKRLLYK